MFIDGSSPLHLKRRRFSNADSMAAQQAKDMLNAAKEKFGREIRVYETMLASSSSPSSPSSSSLSGEESKTEVSDDFYEFTTEDFYRITAKKKEDKYLKTKKLRDAEEAARRSKYTKAVIKIRFPDNHTLVATFHPSEKIQSLLDLLTKVIANPDSPFYIYTTPPKMVIKDTSQDFYSAGFIPGAIVYFAYDKSRGNGGDAAASVSSSFLREEILSLKGLELVTEPAEPEQPKPEFEIPPVALPPVIEEQKPKTDKKPVKPKWLKM